MKDLINRYIARQFHRPSGWGGRLVSHIMNRQNRPMYEETIRLLSLSEVDRVLDIGCGNGYVLKLLAQRYGCVFTGIDISESILRFAAGRNRSFVRTGRMTFACESAHRMSFAGGSFDRAYSVNTAYFWDDLARTTAEIRRVLRQGGLFVNTLYTDETLARLSHTLFGYRRYSAEQLTRAAEGAGFAAGVLSILDGAAWGIVCRAI